MARGVCDVLWGIGIGNGFGDDSEFRAYQLVRIDDEFSGFDRDYDVFRAEFFCEEVLYFQGLIWYNNRYYV
jgi:hypothetical protein